MRTRKPFIAHRLRVLLECKRHEQPGISKSALSEQLGCSQNSIHKWRHQYIRGGIELLMSHKKTGFKPSTISKEDAAVIELKLNDASNSLRGYVELQQWVKDELGKEIAYDILYRHARKRHGSKLKVGRKSHIKKDASAEESFKKSLQRSLIQR